MRGLFALMLASLAATPAGAQTAPAIPPELSDPAMADKLGNVMQSLSNAFLNLPIGEVEAAIEGRPATPADKRTTVRDLGRRDDPDFDRHVQQEIAQSRQTLRAGMGAVKAALPPLMKGLNEARDAIDKAMANMPSPTYPTR
jgi:hypothetical protein